MYLGDGTGTTWTEVHLGEQTEITYGVAAADLNGDGAPEIGFANSGAPNRLLINVEREGDAR